MQARHTSPRSFVRLALFTLALGCGPRVVPPSEPWVSGACEQDLDPVALQKRSRSSVVRIIAHETLAGRDSSGSGFVLATGDDAHLTIVTNYHVIAGGDDFEVVLDHEGRAMTLAGVDIVKVDPKHDLALLRAPRPPHFDTGLAVNTSGPQPGQHVAVMGYPGVQGADFAMTIEEGAVSNPKLTTKEGSYVATNANINPGNSGGPLLDACGDAVGVVVAKVTSTERTGLAIPTTRVEALYERFAAERQPLDAEVTGRLDDFFASLRFQDSVGAAGHVSHRFLATKLAPIYSEFEQRVGAIEQAYARQQNVDLAKLSLEDYLATMAGNLPAEEHTQLVAFVLFRLGEINAYQTLELFLAPYLNVMFGPVEQVRYDVRRDDDTHATVLASASGGGRTVNWTLGMSYERGDWFIDAIGSDQATSSAPAATPAELFAAQDFAGIVGACMLSEQPSEAEFAWWLDNHCLAFLTAVHFIEHREQNAVAALNQYCNIEIVRKRPEYRADLVTRALVLVYASLRAAGDRKGAWTRLQDPLEGFASACHLSVASVKKSTKAAVAALEQRLQDGAR